MLREAEWVADTGMPVIEEPYLRYLVYAHDPFSCEPDPTGFLDDIWADADDLYEALRYLCGVPDNFNCGVFDLDRRRTLLRVTVRTHLVIPDGLSDAKQVRSTWERAHEDWRRYDDH